MKQTDRRSVLDPGVLFRQAFNQRFQFMAVLDSGGNVLEVNDAPTRRGMSREDFLDRHFGATPLFESDPAWIDTWNRRFAEVGATGFPITYEDHFVGPIGERRSADAVLSPVYGDDGHLEYFVVEADDTTERMQVEAMLRDSERRFHDLAESLPVMVWSTDAEGNCDYVNERWLEYTGVAAGQHLGWAWADALHPEDRPDLGDAWVNALRDGTPTKLEFRIGDGAGHYRWFDMRLVPVLGAGGEVVRWYGTAADVHEAHELRRELVEREAQLESAMEAGHMARFAYDLITRKLTSDVLLEELTGHAPGVLDEVGIAGFAEKVHPEDRDRWHHRIAKALRVGSPGFDLQFRVLGPDGAEHPVGMRGRAEFDAAGRPTRMAGIFYRLAGGMPEAPAPAG